jgi:hypothetical protein
MGIQLDRLADNVQRFCSGFLDPEKAWLTTEMMSSEEMDNVITKTNRVLSASKESVLIDKLDYYKKGLIPLFRTIMDKMVYFHFLLPKGPKASDPQRHSSEWSHMEKSAVALDEHDEHAEQWTESHGLEIAQCGGNFFF